MNDDIIDSRDMFRPEHPDKGRKPVPAMRMAEFASLGKCAFCEEPAVMVTHKLLSPTTRSPDMLVCQACFPKTLPALPPEPDRDSVVLKRVRAWFGDAPEPGTPHNDSVLAAIKDLELVIKRLEQYEKFYL